MAHVPGHPTGRARRPMAASTPGPTFASPTRRSAAAAQQLCDGSVPVTLSAPQGMAVSTPAVVGRRRRSARSASAPTPTALQMQRAGAVRRGRGRGLPGQRQAAVRPERPGAGAWRHELRAARRIARACSTASSAAASFRVRTFERRAPQARLRHPSMPDMRLTPAHRRRQRRRLRAGAARRRARAAARQPAAAACASSSTATRASTPRCACSTSAPCTAAASGVRLGCEFIELDGQAPAHAAALHRPHAAAAAPAGAALSGDASPGPPARPGLHAGGAVRGAGRGRRAGHASPGPPCSRSCSAAAAPMR